ncbi:MAG: cation diffusion facilitator family transporter [Candidatus Cryptobacteroides sp.]|nr:cation diffusion facilitator family transporter [Candidatus Cryptobacteroides sp.]
MERDKKVYRVTLLGSVVNLLLLVFKFVAGVLGHSAAMIADAVHSLSDFVTDLIVIVFVKISSKPEDADHAYGHGKYETLASCIIGLALIVVGVMMGYNAVVKIVDVVRNGTELASPGIIALAAAVLSIVLKEWMFHLTRKVAREVDSPAVEANAWHHRSDALSSVGTAIGIGGAVLLGSKWAVLDPIAALVVSVFIVVQAAKILSDAIGQLMEKSLPRDVEQRICEIVYEEEGTSDIHHLRTRKIGSQISIELHVRMNGYLTLREVHDKSIAIEKRLRAAFGDSTYINLHVEPLKSEY